MIKDYLGREIQVGDHVVFYGAQYPYGLTRGVIKEIKIYGDIVVSFEGNSGIRLLTQISANQCVKYRP